MLACFGLILIKSSESSPDIFKAVEDDDFEEVSKLLADNSGLVNNKNSFGLPPLYLAIKACNKKMAALLIFYGANINEKINNVESTLHHAVSCDDQAEMVLLLAANGAGANETNNDNMTPLHTAAILGSRRTVSILILAGAELNPRDKNGNTPLDLAVTNGHKKIAKLLLNRIKKQDDGFYHTPK
jgi:ankyrin repeat protein